MKCRACGLVPAKVNVTEFDDPFLQVAEWACKCGEHNTDQARWGDPDWTLEPDTRMASISIAEMLGRHSERIAVATK